MLVEVDVVVKIMISKRMVSLTTADTHRLLLTEPTLGSREKKKSDARARSKPVAATTITHTHGSVCTVV